MVELLSLSSGFPPGISEEVVSYLEIKTCTVELGLQPAGTGGSDCATEERGVSGQKSARAEVQASRN